MDYQPITKEPDDLTPFKLVKTLPSITNRGYSVVKVINNIHQHIRVVNILDQVGLDFDVISVVLDKYRDRLSGLPKPFTNLTPLGGWRPDWIPSTKMRRCVGIYYGRGRSINRVNSVIYYSKLSPFVSGDLDTPSRSIPRGFKGSVMENWCLIDRLNNTRMFKSFCVDGWSVLGEPGCRPAGWRSGIKPLNYKLMDKVIGRDIEYLGLNWS